MASDALPDDQVISYALAVTRVTLPEHQTPPRPSASTASPTCSNIITLAQRKEKKVSDNSVLKKDLEKWASERDAEAHLVEVLKRGAAGRVFLLEESPEGRQQQPGSGDEGQVVAAEALRGFGQRPQRLGSHLKRRVDTCHNNCLSESCYFSLMLL